MVERNKLRGIIFDMDGVLIDSEPLHYKSSILYLNDELEIGYDEKENREFLGRSDDYMFRVLKDRYGLVPGVQEMINRRRDIYLKLLTGNVELIPGAAEMVRQLKSSGYKLGLASSSLRKIIDLVTYEGQIKAYFDILQSGEHLSTCKPDPEIFLLTAQKMGVDPAACAVIEDTTVGIEAAKVAGMFAIGFDAPGAPEMDFSKADVVVRSFADRLWPELFPALAR